jgi:phenylalanyl-tRNA synthetase alpha chain
LKSFTLTKGAGFTTTIVKPLAEVTRDLVMRDDWSSVPLKPANIVAMGIPPQEGLLHALMQIRSEYREIFLELGYVEFTTACCAHWSGHQALDLTLDHAHWFAHSNAWSHHIL